MIRIPKWLASGLAVLTLACFAAPVQAQDEASQVEQLFAEGASLYRAGKYRAAIDKFDEAYAIYPEPNLLYNKARAHEALGEIAQALATYRKCAASPQVEANVKVKAEQKAQMLEQAQRQTREAPVDPAQPALTVQTPAPESSAGLTVAKWAVTGVAGALAVAGAVVFTMGVSDHNKVTNASADAGGGVATLTLAEAQQLSDDGAQKKTLGVGLMGGAAAAAAGAIVLFLVDGGGKTASQTPALGFAIMPDGGALSWQGTF